MTTDPLEVEPAPFEADPEGDRRKRRLALILLAVQVMALLGVFAVVGAEGFHVVAWLLVPGGLGIFNAIKVLRHPERVGRPRSSHEFDRIIADGGVNLEDLTPDAREGGARLALQDALDAVRQRRGTRKVRVGGHIAATVGTMGWLAASIGSVVTGQPGAAGICLVGAAGFFGLELYLARGHARLRNAERIIERQMQALESEPRRALPGDEHGA